MRLRLALSSLLLVPAVCFAAAAPAVPSVDSTNDHIRGGGDGNPTMVVYSDFQCPFCKRFHATLNDVRSQYPDLRIVYRNFPLSFHPFALPAAKAAECVAREAGQDKYWLFMDDMFSLDQLSTIAIKDAAIAQGLSEASYKSCIADAAIQKKIDADMAGAAAAGVNGTPTSFLIDQNGAITTFVGALPLASLKPSLDKLQFVTTVKASTPITRIQTTKRTARVRQAVTTKGVRRWK